MPAFLLHPGHRFHRGPAEKACRYEYLYGRADRQASSGRFHPRSQDPFRRRLQSGLWSGQQKDRRLFEDAGRQFRTARGTWTDIHAERAQAFHKKRRYRVPVPGILSWRRWPVRSQKAGGDVLCAGPAVLSVRSPCRDKLLSGPCA